MKEKYICDALEEIKDGYLAEALLYPAILKRRRIRRFTAAAACLVLLLAGSFALPGVLGSRLQNGSYSAPGSPSPQPEGSAFFPSESSEEETKSPQPDVTVPSSGAQASGSAQTDGAGGAPEQTQLPPKIPSDMNGKDTGESSIENSGKQICSDISGSSNTVSTKLTLDEAYADPDFGSYMPASAPSGFKAEAITRYTGDGSNSLFATWLKGYKELDWQISYLEEADSTRIVTPEDTACYDLTLYPIPWADSIPENLWNIVNDPIFRAKELTLDMVKARSYTVNETGDTDGYRMNFSVLYEDTVVRIISKGVSPEWIYEQLTSLIEH